MPPGHAGPYHRDVNRLMARAAALSPRLQDLILALALTIGSVAGLVPYRSQIHPFGLAVALVVAQNVPLAWRRSWPFAVLLVSGEPRILYDQLGLGYAPFPLANTIAFFTVMERCSPALRRVTLLLVAIGMTSSQLAPGHNQPYDATVSVLINLTACWAAVLSRRLRAHTQEVEDRA